MPVTLPPISRRRFLQAGAALGAGALLPDFAWANAANDQINPHLIALLSDTHIDQNADEIANGVNLSENLISSVEQILSLDRKPQHALVCGDCAYLTGDAGDYEQFVRVLEPLRSSGVPIHCVLGNHDHRERFYEGGVQETPEDPPVDRKHVGVVEMERANWYLLDSLETTNSTPGILGQAQIDWLAAALDSQPDKPALIMLHHTFDLEAGDETRYGVKDGDALLDMLSEKRQAKALFFGHSHTWQQHQREDGLHMVNLPPTAYIFEEGRPNGWVSCALAEQSLALTLHALDTQHERHGEVVDLTYRD